MTLYNYVLHRVAYLIFERHSNELENHMKHEKAKQIKKQLEQTKKECIRFLEKLEKFNIQNEENIENCKAYNKSDKDVLRWTFIYPNKTELKRACTDARTEIMNLSKILK